LIAAAGNPKSGWFGHGKVDFNVLFGNSFKTAMDSAIGREPSADKQAELKRYKKLMLTSMENTFLAFDPNAVDGGSQVVNKFVENVPRTSLGD